MTRMAADVIVVGAGIAGVTAAIELLGREGADLHLPGTREQSPAQDIQRVEEQEVGAKQYQPVADGQVRDVGAAPGLQVLDQLELAAAVGVLQQQQVNVIGQIQPWVEIVMHAPSLAVGSHSRGWGGGCFASKMRDFSS